jgi:hypothetical protein
MKRSSFVVLFFLLTIFYFTGCTKEESGSIPVVSTDSITYFTETTAQSGGIIVSDGGLEITEMGVCWDTLPNPTILDSKITFEPCPTDTCPIEFKGLITGLTPKTNYYYRAFATNSAGTGYGEYYLFCTCK